MPTRACTRTDHTDNYVTRAFPPQHHGQVAWTYVCTGAACAGVPFLPPWEGVEGEAVGLRRWECALCGLSAPPPFTQVCFGRDVEDTSIPLWSQQSSAPRTGEGGNWNFLEEFSVNVSLPKRMQHHSFLEVKVQDKVQGIGGESMTDVGLAYITLNPLLPWLEPRERTEVNRSVLLVSPE